MDTLLHHQVSCLNERTFLNRVPHTPSQKDGFANPYCGVLLGDQPFAIKTGDLDGGTFLYPVILPCTVLGAVVLHSNNLHRGNGARQIVDDNDPVGTVDVHAVDTHAAGQHQSVVGVELGELAFADGHVHHDPTAHQLIEVAPDERQLPLPAHAAGALKSDVTMRTGAEVQPHTIGAKHIFRLPLSLQMLWRSVSVKDAVEVYVEDHVGQAGDERTVIRLSEVIAA